MIKVNSAGTRTILFSKYVGGRFTYHERTYYRNGRVRYVWATLIAGKEVVLEMNPTFKSDVVGVHFTVGSSYDMVSGRKGRVAMSKWLLSAWEEAVAIPAISHYEASAHQTDNYGDYRVSLYSRLGWVVNEDACYMDEDGPVVAISYSK